MRELPEQPQDDYPRILFEDTDRPLPERLHQGTRYIHFKTLAKGGKSIIQTCRDLHLARTICWKKLKPEFEDDPIEQRRLLREARVSAALQHPNVVPVYEVGRDGRGKLYFTMKRVQGFSLRDLFAPEYRDRYDLSQLVDVLIQVTHALRYAHSHGVIHRDVKPENVLVGPYGEVLLMDWGLAKVWREDGSSEDEPTEEPDPKAKASSLTGAGKLEGTLAYMSPEQLRRDPEIDHRTDIYSLGVALYEVLARRTPFQGETISEVTAQIESATPERPSRVTDGPVPEPLETLAMQCLAKEPGERPPTCRQVLMELQSGWAR